jgi:hypothetical protein
VQSYANPTAIHQFWNHLRVRFWRAVVWRLWLHQVQIHKPYNHRFLQKCMCNLMQTGHANPICNTSVL